MTLTAMLAILGGLILAAVIAHGAWTARKAGPRRADPPIEPQLGERQDPTLGEAKDAVGEPFQPAMPGDETVPLVARQLPRKPSARIDALIDAIATVTLEAPVTGDLAISHLPGSRRAGTKPFHIEGLNAESGEWELPLPGQRYSEFQAGVQMANRSGAMNEIEYSEFVQKVQGFADGLSAFVQFPDMLDVVARARELDQFASEHDAQLAVVLRARSAAWTLGYVQQMALRHGFVPGAIPGRLVLAAEEEGAPPILSLQFDAQAALAEDPQASALRELTLALDVPQTPEALEPFAAWQEAARALSRDIEADVCDDRAQVLNLHAFAAIGQELSTLYKALASRDLAAGSLAARRLFS
ncbi:cell division protein ZipA C-terminal FtsZ-binding domain-containing protein [Paucibacter sediminis]|uniref:Cell division protein ZipA C-terminal FtsZ-binding domain-containing protein n=1 Tax=Paucibacter sediminis TaxID=3019553 RepID=A0AA95NJY3_9BURK|nr:cell division protein ZipA C-terminal FtsZ-binding domain-containing protein [Paucibacter sp. S2-9]WIT10961.1 cell division protein ZipA C-terminal FtsZ-binding domain-containing protein [Paucibacter sp. S2-9]